MNDQEKREEAILILEKLLKDVKMSMVTSWEYEAENSPITEPDYTIRRSHAFRIEYVRV